MKTRDQFVGNEDGDDFFPVRVSPNNEIGLYSSTLYDLFSPISPASKDLFNQIPLKPVEIIKDTQPSAMHKMILQNLYNKIKKTGHKGLVDITGIVKKELKTSKLDEIDPWIVQRLDFSKGFIEAVTSSFSIDLDFIEKISAIQAPFAAWLICTNGSMDIALDPFSRAILRMSLISRRASKLNKKYIIDLFEGFSLSLEPVMNKNTEINEGDFLPALSLAEESWNKFEKRAKMVVDRSELSWIGEVSIMKSRKDIKNRVRSMIVNKESPEPLKKIINNSVIPSLLLFSLRKDISSHDKLRFTRSINLFKQYIDMRTSRLIADIKTEDVKNIYQNCISTAKEAGVEYKPLEADMIHFTRMVAAARGKRTTAKINGQAAEDEKSWNFEPMILTSEIIESEITKLCEYKCHDHEIALTRMIPKGSWLQSISNKDDWIGFIACRLDFTDSLIISDSSGIKIMEISNDELTYQIKSGSITVLDDYLDFAKGMINLFKATAEGIKK